MTAQEQKLHYCFEDYLQLEKDTQERWEYYHGEVFAMAGGSQRHNIIILNTAFLLRTITGKSCRVFTENVKLELIPNGRYVYPDVILTCAPQDLKNDLDTMVRHPSLIVEVLSDTTQAYDQGGKRLAYFELESLQYYVIVWQKACMVEVYERQPIFWKFRSYSHLEDLIEFPLLGFSLPVAEVYRQVEWDIEAGEGVVF